MNPHNIVMGSDEQIDRPILAHDNAVLLAEQ